ncbi:MAG TPA: O-antigen ligase family protein [Gemmatimonadales bacterium]|nr:O-antigen ligase family protein [Gemmatimonadales bacterium]
MTAAVLYCFAWLRPPEIAGVALPVQRVLAWVGLAVILSRLLVKGSVVAGPAARGFLRLVAVFLVFLLLLFVRQMAYGENFFPLYFIMDLSKYAAAFAMAYLCYYALSTRLVDERRFIHGIILSGGLATLFVFLLLGLYFAGFRSENEILAPSFGGALGVWPTGGWLPRLAGPTAEPQQLSVALLTPLLLMLAREHIAHYWPLALVTAAALLLSQSKFAVVSLLFVMLYLFLVYRRWRKLIAIGVLASMPLLAIALIRLPTFAATLEAGLSAGAIVERLGNIVLLLRIIQEHPLFGIGPGHYGVYWGQALHGDWRYNPGYTPNMDFLKVFAETGIAGFLLILLLLGYLVRRFMQAYRRVPYEERSRYLALFLGALAIMLNMTIGYELLHAFFWINIGALLYRADHVTGSESTPPPLHYTEIVPRPVAPA